MANQPSHFDLPDKPATVDMVLSAQENIKKHVDGKLSALKTRVNNKLSALETRVNKRFDKMEGEIGDIKTVMGDILKLTEKIIVTTGKIIDEIVGAKKS